MSSELVEEIQLINKAMLLDNCVDGEQTRFDNLIGKDYDEFKLIIRVLKDNPKVLSPTVSSCKYVSEEELEVHIPAFTSDIGKIRLFENKIKNAALDQGDLILNIAVKKEW